MPTAEAEFLSVDFDGDDLRMSPTELTTTTSTSSEPYVIHTNGSSNGTVTLTTSDTYYQDNTISAGDFITMRDWNPTYVNPSYTDIEARESIEKILKIIEELRTELAEKDKEIAYLYRKLELERISDTDEDEDYISESL